MAAINRKTLLTAIAPILLIAAAGSRADEPLEPVYTSAFCSKNHIYCARSTAAPAHLEVYESKNPARAIWSRAEFVAKGFLSGDGKAVVSCYPGLDLIPIDATLDFLLVRILRSSGKVDEIRLKDVFASLEQVPHSDSHLYWGRCEGIEDGKLILERAGGSRWVSDPL